MRDKEKMKISQAKWREKHKEEIKLKAREYRQNNKEKIKNRNNEYIKNNPEKIKNWSKKSRLKYKEDRNLKQREWYNENKEDKLSKNKEWREDNKERMIFLNRKSRLKRNFNLSIEEYNEKFEKQKGCCKCCGRHQSILKKILSVDHCHKTGEIRDLLCHNCNVVLGLMNEDINRLESLILYIKEHTSLETNKPI